MLALILCGLLILAFLVLAWLWWSVSLYAGLEDDR